MENDKLFELREYNNLTQKAVGEILGVRQQTYAEWEKGKKIIPLKHLVTLANFYNVSIDYALGLTNNSNSKHIIKGFQIDTLAQNLKKYRKKANLTQENIASILKVTQSCVLKYEKAMVCIPIENLYKLCKEYNVTLSKMCGKEK